MNEQEEAVRRPFPLAVVVYHLYLHVLHSGLTPDEVLRKDDAAFGQFIAEGCQITRDAHLVSYQSDERPALAIGIMDGSIGISSRGTENMVRVRARPTLSSPTPPSRLLCLCRACRAARRSSWGAPCATWRRSRSPPSAP